jgi:hypothetical protein
VRLSSWVVDAANGIDILSTKMDAEDNGFAAGLTNCITRDGQSPPSADIPWGGKKLTNLGLATVSTDALSQAAGDARYILSSGATNLTLTGALASASGAFSGNLTVGGTLGLTGAATLTGLVSCGSFVTCTANGTGFQLTDASGSHPLIAVDGSNNLTLFGTNATGAALALFTVGVRNSTPTFTFNVAAAGQTPSPGDNSTKLATTAFITTALGSYAPLASPALTGTPTAPTAAVNTNTTQIASTAYVMAAKAPTGQNIASAATVTPNATDDLVAVTALAANVTLANPASAPADGWGIVIRLKDNGTPRTIAYGTQYRAVGTALPTTTVASKNLYFGCIWNNADSKLDVVSVAQE